MEKQRSGASLREKMPVVAEIVDAFRAAFGVETVDALIRAAIKDGMPTFWARENGVEVGVKIEGEGCVPTLLKTTPPSGLNRPQRGKKKV